MTITHNPTLSLDVASPDDVARVLLAAADAYHDSSAELESAWQSKERAWTLIARELEDAAGRITTKLHKIGW